MKIKYFYFAFFSLIISCNNSSKNKTDYFKITFTDAPNPQNILAEFIEVSSEGTLVILTNRFNKESELYQTHHFVELTKQQLDTIKGLINTALDIVVIPESETDVLFKLNYEQVNNGSKQNSFVWLTKTDNEYLELVDYCKNIPTYSKLYDMDGAYYFNTEEVCEN